MLAPTKPCRKDMNKVHTHKYSVLTALSSHALTGARNYDQIPALIKEKHTIHSQLMCALL